MNYQEAMKQRFNGEHGKRILLEAVKSNELVDHNEALATALVEKGKVVEIKHGERFIEQNAIDNDLYLIVSGQADVFVNERHVATRQARDFVGEMALIDPAARRSATVTARGELVLLQITEPSFQEIAQAFPTIWKPIALVIAERLRQRAQFHRTPNPKPELFIGCAVEGMPIAREIQAGLVHDNVNVTIWDQGVFGPSSISVDALLKAFEQSDFAVLVFRPEDKVKSRGTTKSAPRDNVVFELGLAMGGMGRERAFIVKQEGVDIKIPSDLLGITPIQYKLNDPKRLTADLGPVCLAISKQVKDLGVR